MTGALSEVQQEIQLSFVINKTNDGPLYKTRIWNVLKLVLIAHCNAVGFDERFVADPALVYKAAHKINHLTRESKRFYASFLEFRTLSGDAEPSEKAACRHCARLLGLAGRNGGWRISLQRRRIRQQPASCLRRQIAADSPVARHLRWPYRQGGSVLRNVNGWEA